MCKLAVSTLAASYASVSLVANLAVYHFCLVVVFFPFFKKKIYELSARVVSPTEEEVK